MIRLTPFHAGLMAEMHKACFNPSWTEKDMNETLAQPGVFGFLVGEEEPEGFVLGRVTAGEAEILILMVLPECRRKGRGRALLLAAIDEALAGGASMMFLEVDAENFRAQVLYEGEGFYTVGLRPRYYGNSDALILRKDLCR